MTKQEKAERKRLRRARPFDRASNYAYTNVGPEADAEREAWRQRQKPRRKVAWDGPEEIPVHVAPKGRKPGFTQLLAMLAALGISR